MNILIKQAEISEFDAVLNVDPFEKLHHEKAIKSAIERGECFAAWVDDKIQAFALISRSFFGFEFIDLLAVAEKRRRQGIGRAMLDYLYGACETMKLFTSTNQSNIPMQKLLDKAGFSYCGIIDALDEGDPELFYVRYVFTVTGTDVTKSPLS